LCDRFRIASVAKLSIFPFFFAKLYELLNNKDEVRMIKYYSSVGSSRVLKSIVIIVLLLAITAVVAILFSSFLPNGFAGTVTVILIFGIISLVSYIVARSIGMDKVRSSKQKRVTTVLCAGFASFFGYAAIVVVSLGHPFRFPSNLPLFLAVVLAAALTSLISDIVSKKLGVY
jgi:CDP-diglyceride synthetase